MKPKEAIVGHPLRTRIRHLFQEVGFKTTPKDEKDKEVEVVLAKGKKRPIDLLAEAKGLRIMVECTGKKDFSITDYIHHKKEIGTKIKADKILLIVTGREIAETDKEYAKGFNTVIWTQKEVKYFEEVISAIGQYAIYEIISYLELETDESRTIYNVYALKINQPLPKSRNEIYIFSINPEILLKTAVVFRRALGEAKNYQRILKGDRLPGIGRYVSTKDAIFPVDIIVALNDKVASVKLEDSQFVDINSKKIIVANKRASEVHVLGIPQEYGSLEIIDGQHRLFGFTKCEDEKIVNGFNLIVAGIKGADMEQKRDIFVSINTKSRRMDPNLVANLKYVEDEAACIKDAELMALKIVFELNKRKPFQNRIRMLDEGEQKVTLKGFSGYNLKGLISSRGLLRKYCSNNSADYVSILQMYFSMVRSVLGKSLWEDSDKYIIATNRGISAFLLLLRSILKNVKARLDEKNVRPFLLPLKRFNFQTSYLKGKYVGTAGWKKFQHDLIREIRKTHPKFKS